MHCRLRGLLSFLLAQPQQAEPSRSIGFGGLSFVRLLLVMEPEAAGHTYEEFDEERSRENVQDLPGLRTNHGRGCQEEGRNVKRTETRRY